MQQKMTPKRPAARTFSPDQLAQIDADSRPKVPRREGGKFRQGEFKDATERDIQRWKSDGVRTSNSGAAIGDHGLRWVFTEKMREPTFFFASEMGGKRRTLSLGKASVLTLKEAKLKAAELQKQLREGTDVFNKISSERALKKNRATASLSRPASATSENFGLRELGRPERGWTFDVFCEYFYRNYIFKKVKTHHINKRRMQAYMIPRFNDVAMSEIRHSDIIELLNGIQHPSVWSKVYYDLVRIFDSAVLLEVADRNVVCSEELSKKAYESTVARSRALDDEEIASLFNIISNSTQIKFSQPFFAIQNYYAVRLLLSCGGRKQEILTAQWRPEKASEGDELVNVVDIKAGLLYLADTKTGAPLLIKLSDYALDTFKALKALAGGDKHVFPQRRDGGKNRGYMGSDTLNRALKAIMPRFLETQIGREYFTVHDLRRTARTAMGDLGIDEGIAERCIGHTTRPRGRMPGIYDHSKSAYTQKMEEAFDKLGKHIASLDAGYQNPNARIFATKNENC